MKSKGTPRGSIPAFQSEFARHLESSNGAVLDVRFDGLKHESINANVSCLRSAYLAAFARLGYEPIRDPVYEPVRQQIREPAVDLGLAPFVFNSPDPDRRGIVELFPPHEAPGVLVLMGPQFVQLPLPNDQGFWGRIHDLANRHAPLTVRRWHRRWPTEPTFDWDFWLQRRASRRGNHDVSRQD